jgi:acetolactate synthase-1/2/3 large subunit
MFHGGRIVARALKNEGIDHLFTLCGGHIQNIYDGCLDVGIRVVDVRHEQTAGHAADGWARVTGKPGVAPSPRAPGVTDVVTAVANAQRAGVPMVCIGGAGPTVLTDRARSRTWTTST